MSANKLKYPEQISQKDQEKKDGENQNGLEKLIKMDKKHANFDLIDNRLNKKLKIRNCPNQTVNLAQNNSTDYLLRLFWRHINGYYFRRIDTAELERLEYLDQVITLKIKKAKQKYQSFESFWAIQDIFLPGLKTYYKDQNISKLNYKNLVKHIRIASEIYQLQQNNHDYQELMELKEESLVKNYKDNEIKALEDEGEKLDIVIQKLEQNSEKNRKQQLKQKQKQEKAQQQQSSKQQQTEQDQEIQQGNMSLQDEIDFLQKELMNYTHSNKENLDKLNEKVRIEINFGNVLFNESKNGVKNPNCTSKLPEQYFQLGALAQMKEDHFNRVSGPLNQDIQAQYLLSIIKKLEVIQISESISSISGFKKGSKQDLYSSSDLADNLDFSDEYESSSQSEEAKSSSNQRSLQKKRKAKQYNMFEVNFEYSVNPKSKWVLEEDLLFYNSFRDQTLYQCYNTSQKSQFQHVSQNKVQFDFIKSNRDKVNTKKGLPMEKIMSSLKNTEKSSAKEMRKFQICHHCKQFIPQKHLVPCTYKSSVLGLPILNQNVTDPFLSQQMELETIPKKPRFGCAQSYIYKDNDYVCLRQFCKACLKQNYDIVLAELNQEDFLCPVCTGTCFCSRCLRNDMITKIKGMFLLYGGDPAHIYLGNKTEEFLRPQIYEDVRKRYKEEIGSLNVDSKSTLKQNNLKVLQKMKNLKIDMQKMLLLSSAVMRREKLKTQQMLSSVQLFQKKCEIISCQDYQPTGYELIDQLIENQNQSQIAHQFQCQQDESSRKEVKSPKKRKKKNEQNSYSNLDDISSKSKKSIKMEDKESSKKSQNEIIISEKYIDSQQQINSTHSLALSNHNDSVSNNNNGQKRSRRLQLKSQQQLDQIQ